MQGVSLSFSTVIRATSLVVARMKIEVSVSMNVLYGKLGMGFLWDAEGGSTGNDHAMCLIVPNGILQVRLI